MSAAYGWIIDVDHAPDKDSPEGTNGNAKGVVGPHRITDDIAARLRVGGGRTFLMRDADGESVYTGRIITAPDEEGGELDFRPLDDFGTPNGCATEIHYQRDNGTWFEL